MNKLRGKLKVKDVLLFIFLPDNAPCAIAQRIKRQLHKHGFFIKEVKLNKKGMSAAKFLEELF